MNWIYTVVFSGLLFSSSETPVDLSRAMPVAEPTQNVIVLDETERFEQTYPLNANGTVNVSNINGSITIEAWDRSEVKFESIKKASTKEDLEKVRVNISPEPQRFTVDVDYGRRNWVAVNGTSDVEVTMKLTVPKGAVLRSIQTVNGSITVSDVASPDAKIVAVNGNVTMENIRGNVDLSTVNGQVKAGLHQVERGRRISLSTVNGSVDLSIPSDTSSILRIESMNGEISSDFGLTVKKGKFVGRSINARLGGGDGLIRLNSVNGNLSVQRRKDGRTPSAIVNLELDSDVGKFPVAPIPPLPPMQVTPDVRREMAKVRVESRRAQREAARAVAQSAKELEKLQPKLAEIEKLRASGQLTREVEEQLKAELAEVNRTVIKESVRRSLESTNFGLSGLRFNWGGSAPFASQKTNSFKVAGTPVVTIDAGRSAVRVRGWDRDEVKYVLTTYTRDDKNRPVVTENAGQNSVSLKVEYADQMPGQMRLEIYVPKNSNITVKHAGEIRISGVRGTVDLESAEDFIDVRDVSGRLSINVVEGRVRIIDFAGDLVANGVDSDIFLDGDFSSINTSAGDGRVVLTLPKDADAEIRSDTDLLAIGDIKPEKVGDGLWRLGSGRSKFLFNVGDGELELRSRTSLEPAGDQ